MSQLTEWELVCRALVNANVRAELHAEQARRMQARLSENGRTIARLNTQHDANVRAIRDEHEMLEAARDQIKRWESGQIGITDRERQALAIVRRLIDAYHVVTTTREYSILPPTCWDSLRTIADLLTEPKEVPHDAT